MAGAHLPVMASEGAMLLACRPGGTYVDATAGSGGHALELLRRYPDIGRLICIDCDAEAVGRTAAALSTAAVPVMVLHGNFRNLRELLAGIGVGQIDGILFDLGVSTPQLTDPERGFSFSSDAVLDMRMDRTTQVTAKELIARWSEQELADALHRYGQERWARRIARHIVRARRHKPIERTTQLARLVMDAVPRHRDRIHPATRTFQALRIAVNDELASIEHGLDAAIDLLTPGGRICAISFHSLEDGIVKNRFRDAEKGCRCPATFPVCRCGGAPVLRVLTRKPLRPSAREVAGNPSARSARLRAAEKVVQR